MSPSPRTALPPAAARKPSSSKPDHWAWIVVSLIFVVLTLAALVVTPILVQRRVDVERARIEASEPARTQLMALQFNLVREMALLNRLATTRDTAVLREFEMVRGAETEIWRQMQPLTRALGSQVHERFVEARTIADIWHNREDREGFADLLDATARLDSTILSVTAVHRSQIGRAERFGLLLTFGSGALALLTALVVAALVVRIRRLGAESETRRQELAEALVQSAHAAEARERLMRGVTHDVKNPLGAARGYAELLSLGLKGPLNDEQNKLVAGVERSIDSALAIISDLLDLARADSGGVKIHRVETDLNDLARAAAEDHRPAAENAGHTIEFQPWGEQLPSYTDPMRVRQVLDNLISNAIKYTRAPGRIVITADPNARDAPFAARTVAIRVRDTGPGIPPEQHDRIFDEFTRVEDGAAVKGHGLGLAIARRMARLIGGELGLAGSDENGSMFVLWLPQREQRDPPR